MVKIYTKTGDKGETSLFGGKRVSKASLRIEAVGVIDELNSAIGIAIAENQKSTLRLHSGQELKTELLKIQHDLFTIGSILASPGTIHHTLNPIPLKDRITDFEKLIDKLTGELPELRNFVLPGGSRAGAALHLTRTICRRAERRVVALSKKEQIDEQILVYLNRSSDLLFTMARFVNFKQGKKEIIWKKDET